MFLIWFLICIIIVLDDVKLRNFDKQQIENTYVGHDVNFIIGDTFILWKSTLFKEQKMLSANFAKWAAFFNFFLAIASDKIFH